MHTNFHCLGDELQLEYEQTAEKPPLIMLLGTCQAAEVPGVNLGHAASRE